MSAFEYAFRTNAPTFNILSLEFIVFKTSSQTIINRVYRIFAFFALTSAYSMRKGVGLEDECDSQLNRSGFHKPSKLLALFHWFTNSRNLHILLLATLAKFYTLCSAWITALMWLKLMIALIKFYIQPCSLSENEDENKYSTFYDHRTCSSYCWVHLESQPRCDKRILCDWVFCEAVLFFFRQTSISTSLRIN